jgi:hypothetical protein
MKYKVGDKVRIKNIDWYNENKDSDDEIWCSPHWFRKEHSKWCGKVMTISCVKANHYIMKEVGNFDWTDEMIECLVERNGKTYTYKIGDRVILKGNNRCATITDLKYNSWGNLSYYIKIDNDKDISIDYPTDLLLPYDNKVKGLVEDGTIVDYVKESNDRYRIVIDPRFDIEVDEGEYYAVRRKKEYPKTLKECRRMLDIDSGCLLVSYDLELWKDELLGSLQKLLICRDAYWKIAGEEMGLGKQWEPDWTNQESPKYCIAYVESKIKTAERNIINTILSFPTAEMRDAFYENFKEEIEQCKELL